MQIISLDGETAEADMAPPVPRHLMLVRLEAKWRQNINTCVSLLQHF